MSHPAATPTRIAPVLIAGAWRASAGAQVFQATNPSDRSLLPQVYPVSDWDDCEAALDAAASAFRVMRGMSRERLAEFLEAFAMQIDHRADEICELAESETALPFAPRLREIELPRTTNQLRQAAAAARDRGWSQATIDTAANIRSMLAPLGPVAVFGPNNFPLAFNSISGGDFAAAIAAGNPVIAKANSSHPGTTRLLAEEASQAAMASGMPAGAVQLIYRTSHADGERLVADPRLGACGYTGSQAAGLKLKAAADAVGKPIYLELSSINPVLILPGALEERLEQIAEEFCVSCLMGSGQFCTNPGLVVLLAGGRSAAFLDLVSQRFGGSPPGTLLSPGVEESLARGIEQLEAAGAKRLTDGPADQARCCYPNTLLHVMGRDFLETPDVFQSEAFGNAALVVEVADVAEGVSVIEQLEGNLTGCIYSATNGDDDEAYDAIAPSLRQRVGRLLNDKMPTGVAVSAAMNHGGPFPATGHPGFTAVGIPAALTRFSMLQSFDQVRQHRLPPELKDTNPTGAMWRRIDGEWTQADVGHHPK